MDRPTFTFPQDQDPADFKAGLLASEPGQTPGCIHDHTTASGKRYRHSHVGFDAPHTHDREG